MPLAQMLAARLLAAQLLGVPWAELAPDQPGPELPPPPPRPAEYALTWEAPPECPSAASILERVGTLMRDPTGGTGTALVRAQVTSTDDGYHLVLATEYLGAIETRVLDAARCDALADATALVIAVAMQPSLAVEPRPRAAPSIEAERAPPEPDAALEPIPEPAPPRPRRSAAARGLLRIAALGEWGALPGLSGGAALVLGGAWPRIRAEIEGLWLAPRSTTRQGGRSARVQLAGASVRACYRILVRNLELPACAGLEAAAAIATPRGTTSGDRLVGPSIGPKIGFGIARQLGRFGIFAAAEVVGRAYGTELTVDGTVLFTQAPASGRLWLGVELFVP